MTRQCLALPCSAAKPVQPKEQLLLNTSWPSCQDRLRAKTSRNALLAGSDHWLSVLMSIQGFRHPSRLGLDQGKLVCVASSFVSRSTGRELVGARSLTLRWVTQAGARDHTACAVSGAPDRPSTFCESCSMHVHDQ